MGVSSTTIEFLCVPMFIFWNSAVIKQANTQIIFDTLKMFFIQILVKICLLQYENIVWKIEFGVGYLGRRVMCFTVITTT